MRLARLDASLGGHSRTLAQAGIPSARPERVALRTLAVTCEPLRRHQNRQA